MELGKIVTEFITEHKQIADLAVIAATSITTVTLWATTIEPLLDSRASRGGYVKPHDPRTTCEQLMNSLGYYKSETRCPAINPNSNSMLGRFATRRDYYKRVR